MPTRYEVYLDTDTGHHLALFDSFQKLEWVRTVNAVGAFTLVLPHDVDSSLLAPDRRIQVWRGVTGSELRMVFAGFLRQWRWNTDATGRTFLTLSGFDANHLLTRRIIAYAAGSAEASQDTHADTMMTEVVAHNLGANSTVTVRDLTTEGLTVRAGVDTGAHIDKAFSWRPLLDVLQDIAETAAATTTAMYFDIVPTSLSGLEFRTFPNQRGVDHRYPDGNPPLLFGLEYGNLETPVLEYDYSQEVTHVYGGGQGEGADRLIVEVEDTARKGSSIWNRIEAFVDARSCATSAGVEDKAYEKLNASKPVLRFSGKIVETPGCQFGPHWDFGDRVTCAYHGQQFDVMIDSIHVTMAESGAETINARLRSV